MRRMQAAATSKAIRIQEFKTKFHRRACSSLSDVRVTRANPAYFRKGDNFSQKCVIKDTRRA